MDSSLLPTVWKSVLNKIQSVFPNAIIAGGALRDTVLDLEVKDVDIFIHNVDDVLFSVADIRELLGVPPDESDTASVTMCRLDGYNILSNRRKISNLINVSLGGVLYQLVFVSMPPIRYVDECFDFGLCKIYFDGTVLKLFDEFQHDLDNQQITLLGAFTERELARSVFAHRQQIIKKLPGWKVVIHHSVLLAEESASDNSQLEVSEVDEDGEWMPSRVDSSFGDTGATTRLIIDLIDAVEKGHMPRRDALQILNEMPGHSRAGFDALATSREYDAFDDCRIDQLDLKAFTDSHITTNGNGRQIPSAKCGDFNPRGDIGFSETLDGIAERMKAYGATNSDIDAALHDFSTGYSAESCFGDALRPPSNERYESDGF